MMSIFNLPTSTNLKQRLKSGFEKKFKSRKLFEDIDKIILIHKLSKNTINISPTDNVLEILIFQIDLKVYNIPTKAINTIISAIPYPILFYFTYKEEFCYGVSLIKEKKLYLAPWNKQIEFDFNDTNLERVYQDIVKKFLINLDKIENLKNKEIDFQQAVKLDKEIEDLQKKINILKSKRDKQKQFNKKAELNKELKQLQKELEKLKESVK